MCLFWKNIFYVCICFIVIKIFRPCEIYEYYPIIMKLQIKTFLFSEICETWVLYFNNMATIIQIFWNKQQSNNHGYPTNSNGGMVKTEILKILRIVKHDKRIIWKILYSSLREILVTDRIDPRSLKRIVNRILAPKMQIWAKRVVQKITLFNKNPHSFKQEPNQSRVP